MTLLYPSLLWLILPLALWLFRCKKSIITVIHIIILILLVLTLSRPVQKEALQEANIQAKDIIIALDVSYSMKATDISPTRYDFAKETIKALLKRNPSDNIMLIAFTTNPLILSPPTTDHTLIAVALDSLNPEFILTKGTSLEKLFKKISTIKQGHKNLILISDGGEESDTSKLVPLLQSADISLITLALGSTQGTTVEKNDGNLLKDKEGNLVISRINPLLETLSALVGGSYLEASISPHATADALNAVLLKKHNLSQNIQKMQHYYLELYQIPLLLAVLLFLFVHTRAVKYLLILFTFFGFQAEASLFDEYHLHKAYEAYALEDYNTSQNALKKITTKSLQSQIALANSYFKTAQYKKAITLYKSIQTTSASTKQQLYYNIATAYAKQAVYSKAKVHYTKALQLGYDEDAQHNLEIIILLEDKDNADVGIAHPKSQSGASSKSESQDKEETKSEDQPSSGSGSGGENKSKEDKKETNKLLDVAQAQKQPLGSKVYELINKGYIRETQPW